MANKNPTDAKYWKEYDGLQHAKHQLLKRYLGGWFPILGSWSGRVLYVDCHAGRGRHKTGHEGSPILALNVLLDHSHRDRILEDTKVNFVFCEIDEKKFRILSEEIEGLGDVPENIIIAPFQENYEQFLRATIVELKQRGQQLAPTFAFVDPYGFTIPMDLMNDLLEFPACELFINFMFRYVDLGINNESQKNNMDLLFGCTEWRGLTSAKIHDPRQRAESIIQLYSKQLKAKYVTHMYMRGENNALKYVLIHATNNKRGRELMKEAIWNIKPDGSFTAYERHRPEQLILIQPEPNLSPLEDRIWEDFAGEKVYANQLHEWIVGEIFRKTHLHKILRSYRNQKIIEAREYEGRFAFKHNPLFCFPKKRPK